MFVLDVYRYVLFEQLLISLDVVFLSWPTGHVFPLSSELDREPRVSSRSHFLSTYLADDLSVLSALAGP